MGLAAIAAIILIEAVCWLLAFQPARAGQSAVWLLSCAPTIVLGLFALVRALRRGTLGAWLKPAGGDIALGVLFAAVQYGAALLVVRGVMGPGSLGGGWLARLAHQLGDTSSLHAHPALSFLGLSLTCACEEILWRGLVMELISDRIGSRYAWVLQAIANALIYVPMVVMTATTGMFDPILPAIALAGALLTGAITRWRGGRLPAAIVAHALFDFTAVVLVPLVGQ
jgi:membrane protease YdiL (CAAX protease family)